MKVSFSLGGNDIVRQGFVNIDPLCDPNDAQRIRANIDQLDLYADDGEIEQLTAVDIIDYVPVAEKEKIIDCWLKKISLHGQIVIGGTDLNQATKAFVLGHIDLQKTNDILYGNQIAKNGVTTCNQICDLLISKGYKIVSKKIIDLNYIVIAERN